ncbi:BQ2448_1962 [Microbotryum intermedium]|uniref:BQ2448_1962 protein n=1 Tax=Microbotryum intermedium TaxID=269621 RepID=A0A238F4Q2_9BASI|nr:BQ2448_1962 [Microbotryum intermedium]
MKWPNVATEQVTTRLDLVNELEQRQSRTIWAARWTPFDPEQKSPTLIAKVISAKRAASIAREYFIYTRIVPQLSAAAQTFFPPLQGVYRSGMDGQAYVVLLECSGVVVTTKQLDKDEELRKRIRTALDLIKSEGLSQFNEAVFKVVRREDGRIFIVDWGEAMLTPSFNLSLSLESSVN